MADIHAPLLVLPDELEVCAYFVFGHRKRLAGEEVADALLAVN